VKGHIPRQCWNGCGVEIVHKLDDGAYAWVETASGKRHRCAGVTSASKSPSPPPAREYSKPDRAGIIADFSRDLPPNVQVVGNRIYMARGVWFPKHIRVIGEHYRPVTHRPRCDVPPWIKCDCQ
jgi:hypothetical protein